MHEPQMTKQPQTYRDTPKKKYVILILKRRK